MALVALLVACRSGPQILQPPKGEQVPSLGEASFEYRVGAGDVVRVNVFGHPELSSPTFEAGTMGTPVDGSGALMLPLIGALPAAGRTVAEIADATTGRLRRYLRDPRVDVAVVRFGAHRILVLGEVAKPGSYVLERPTSAMEALSMAEGFGTFARRSQVAWVHGALSEENLILFDAGGIDPVAAGLVAPGDVLFVGRRDWSDAAEAARDLLPLLAFVTQPISVAIQAATLSKIR